MRMRIGGHHLAIALVHFLLGLLSRRAPLLFEDQPTGTWCGYLEEGHLRPALAAFGAAAPHPFSAPGLPRQLDAPCLAEDVELHAAAPQ